MGFFAHFAKDFAKDTFYSRVRVTKPPFTYTRRELPFRNYGPRKIANFRPIYFPYFINKVKNFKA